MNHKLIDEWEQKEVRYEAQVSRLRSQRRREPPPLLWAGSWPATLFVWAWVFFLAIQLLRGM